MRTVLFSALAAVWGLALSATVYKWVDEDGVTHYSDQPHPGAQKVEVDSAQTYSAPRVPPSSTSVSAPKAAGDAGLSYKLCEIYKPAADEVFFNEQSVTVKVRIDPALRSGDHVVVALDGKRATQDNAQSGEYVLSPVYRGEHQVSAIIEDAQGKRVCTAQDVTFHVRQASVLSPQHPLRPKPTPHMP